MVSDPVRPGSDRTGARLLRPDPRQRRHRADLPAPLGRARTSALGRRRARAAGNGLLLFFRVDDFEAALRRARTLVPALDEEPHSNPATGTQEFALRDPDGYYVMVSALPA
ncbi:VOC family protein [Lysobacter enzymogenes]|uniref:VOC family protein n=1 Tax=Lysobacter enzymogenes TaxID=69 RepID=UPI003D187BF1